MAGEKETQEKDSMVNDLFILRITSKSADVKNEIEKSQNQAHRLEIDRLKKSSKNVNRTAVMVYMTSMLFWITPERGDLMNAIQL